MLASLLVWSVSASANDAKPLRLFLLSGQSNMVKVDPAVFAEHIQEAMPDDEVVVVHDAQSGQLIRRWYKDWPRPDDTNIRRHGKGQLYDRLMGKVTEAMEGKPAPATITFVWMQGEADGNHVGFGDLYQDSLEGLLKQLQADLGRDDIDFVLGRISDFGNDKAEERPSWAAVRAAQVAFVEDGPQSRAWVDTDDLNGDFDGLHYTKDGYQQLTERFAEAAIKLLQDQAD